MKKPAAAMTILISLAAMTGCNSGDADYVSYIETTRSEFEESQKEQAVPVGDASFTNETAGDLTPTSPPAAASTSSDNKQVETPVVSIGTAATHSAGADPVDSDSVGGGTPAPNQANRVADDSSSASISTTPTSIVSSQSGLTGRVDTPEIDNTAVQTPNRIELLIPDKSFRRERGTDAVRISYDDIDLLKVLNMEPVPPNAVEYFPAWLASLNGKRIRIRGFMFPKYIQEGITSFTLARDNGICCFQRMPKIYDVIFVKLEPGQTTDYIDARPFDVEGTFLFDNEDDGTELPRLYKIENARVLD